MTESRIELITMIVYRGDKDTQWKVFEGRRQMSLADKDRLQKWMERRYRQKWIEETGMDGLPRQYVPIKVFARYRDVG